VGVVRRGSDCWRLGRVDPADAAAPRVRGMTGAHVDVSRSRDANDAGDRAGRPRLRWFPTLLFALTVGVWLAPSLSGQRTLAAVDMLELGAPYRDAIGRPPHVASPINTDQAEMLAAPAAYFRELRQPDWQLWDNNVAGGTPTGIFAFNGLFSPFSVPYLVFPPWYAIGVKAALSFLFCQWFMYLFLRRLGAGVVPATIGSVAYTFTGANLVLLHRMSAPLVLPAALWAVDRLVDRPSLRRVLPVTVFLAWCWYEGFPSGFVYSAYLTAAWGAWLLLRRGWRDRHDGSAAIRGAVKPGLFLGLAGAWACALAAMTVIPLASELVWRGILEGREAGIDTHLSHIQFFGIFDTWAVGRYPSGGPWWTGSNPVESVTHVGMIASLGVFLAIVGVIVRRLPLNERASDAFAFFCFVATSGIFLTFVGTRLLGLVYRLPGFTDNPISRSRFVIGLSAAVISTLALDAWWKGRTFAREGSSRYGPAVVGSFLLFALVAYLGLSRAGEYVMEARAVGQFRFVARGILLGLLLAVVCVGLAAVARSRVRFRFAAGAAIIGLLYVQLWYPLRHFTPQAPVDDYYSIQPGHRALQRLLDGRFRFAASGLFNFYPNSAQVFGEQDLRGQALHSLEFKHLVSAAEPTAFSRDPLKIIMPKDEWNVVSPILDDLSVRYFALGTDDVPYGIEYGDPPPIDSWSSRPLPAEARTVRAPGPVSGLLVPLKAGQCKGRVTVSVTAHGRTRSASRPAFDARGDWMSFAMVAEDLRAGDPAVVDVAASDPSCALETGASRSKLALRLLGPDPALPLKVVSTEQAWIYERVNALPLVRSHAVWKTFPDQKTLLPHALLRPPSELNEALLVEPAPDPKPGARPARIGPVDWDGDRIEFSTDGPDETLVVVAQNGDRGWTATVDGAPRRVLLAHGVLMGIMVPGGSHRVELRYRPASHRAGTAISAVALAALVASAVVTGLRSRRNGRRSTATKAFPEGAGPPQPPLQP
ncbi:MAG TPA: hypothetical protein VNE62_07615, partial [Actinomycetota bacterium]|nr:hypothetical protein [Actinomycetota bacterium]